MTDWTPRWTPEMKAQLRALWGNGLSARQIAAEMGLENGRNKVIGQARRLGLEKRNSPILPKGSGKPKKPKTYIKVKRLIVSHNHARITRVRVPEVVVMPKHEESTGISLEECQARKNACRWPLGGILDKPRAFCGQPQESGSAYCPYHRAKSTGHATGSMAAAERILANHAR